MSIRKIIILIGLPVLITVVANAQTMQPMRLWFNKPANASLADNKNGWINNEEWLKALPLGNGFLGAMVFGDVNKERIQLNEKSLWSGSSNDSDNPNAYSSLNEIRKLLWEGKYKEATELTNKSQVCQGAGSGNGNGAAAPFGCFQTLGDLWLDFGKSDAFNSYHRELDMNNGIVQVSYQQNDIQFKREIFTSFPDRALVIRLSANKKGALSFKSTLNRPERFETHSENGQLMMTGTLNNGKGGNGMNYVARLKAMATGGTVTFSKDTIVVKNADEVILLLTAATNYKPEYPNYQGNDPIKTTLEQLAKATSKSFLTLLNRHTNDFSALFGKVILQLSGNDPDTIPTDIRLKNQKNKIDDFHLQEIYFQYGRYLLISSSREGSLPANLQGIWANERQSVGYCRPSLCLLWRHWPGMLSGYSFPPKI